MKLGGLGKRTKTVLDIITDFYYIVKYNFHFIFGGAMKIGTLVKLTLDRPSIICIGVIIGTDNDFEYGRVYNIAFANSDTEWWLEDDLEVLCK